MNLSDPCNPYQLPSAPVRSLSTHQHPVSLADPCQPLSVLSDPCFPLYPFSPPAAPSLAGAFWLQGALVSNLVHLYPTLSRQEIMAFGPSVTCPLLAKQNHLVCFEIYCWCRGSSRPGTHMELHGCIRVGQTEASPLPPTPSIVPANGCFLDL